MHSVITVENLNNLLLGLVLSFLISIQAHVFFSPLLDDARFPIIFCIQPPNHSFEAHDITLRIPNILFYTSHFFTHGLNIVKRL